MAFLKLEKNLAENTARAYLHDVRLFREFIVAEFGLLPEEIEMKHIEAFLAHLHDRGHRRATTARMLSGVRSFYQFLLIRDRVERSPAELIENPKISRKLPVVLTVDEIGRILETFDLSTPQGHRNKAMIETLYSCGVRVTELVGLRLNDLFFDDGFLRVTGKGDKQRLVPVSRQAVRQINLYLDQRKELPQDPKHKDILFLNHKGRQLSRVMVFLIIKEAVRAAGISKEVSPHTFRHSFATHLVQGGADIRVVQEMLGHESIATTEIYTHLNKEFLKNSLRNHPLADWEWNPEPETGE